MTRPLGVSASRLGLAVALAVLTAVASPVRAEVLISPLTEGGIGPAVSDQVVCYLANVGSSSITVSNPKILNQNARAVPLSINTCGRSLAGGRICVWAVNQSGADLGDWHLCRVDLSSKTNARGSMDLRKRNGSGAPKRIFSLEMR
ncbi:MAG: hypothetical protein U1E45_08965 [Geminicoccaceae bacterium]